MKWAALQTTTLPELALLFAVPNGGHRHPATGAKLKAEGVKPGVPDLWLPVPRNLFHGLVIELKTELKSSKVSAAQEWWINSLNNHF